MILCYIDGRWNPTRACKEENGVLQEAGRARMRVCAGDGYVGVGVHPWEPVNQCGGREESI